MIAGASWSAAPATFRLGPDDVHVWRATLDLPAGRVGELDATVAPAERAQAARFRSARDGRRFLVARAVLRAILGRR